MTRGIHPTPAGQRKLRITEVSQAEVLRMLVDGPCSAQEIVAETGLSIHTVRRYIKALHSRKLVYLYDKVPAPSTTLIPGRPGRRAIHVWHWGPDKPDRYKPRSDIDRAKDYRATVRAERARYAASFINADAVAAAKAARKVAPRQGRGR